MTTTINSKTITTVKADSCIYLRCPDNERELVQLHAHAQKLAAAGSYKKIVGKVPARGLKELTERGYQVEAEVPGLYKGEEAGYFIAHYCDPQRKHWDKKEERTIASVKTIALATKGKDEGFTLPEGCSIQVLEPQEFDTLGSLYQRAYPDYPAPEEYRQFIRNNQDLGHDFYGLFKEGILVEAARLAKFPGEGHAEVSDFATHPDYRGRNLSYYLIKEILTLLETAQIRTLYGLPRASSYGLNITFSKLGFDCGGTLRNTRLMGGSLESLNVWHRKTSS